MRGRLGVLAVVASMTASMTVSSVASASAPMRGGGPPGDWASYVNPFIGTAAGATDYGTGGGAGNTFPGPALPNGMIQLGPDTLPANNNVGGGYDYADSVIRGFSLRHMSGPGCANYRDVPIIPTTQPIASSPVQPFSLNVTSNFLASFSHQSEDSSAGDYRVVLNPQSGKPITTELTTTLRAAAARFTFPRSVTSSVLINAGGSAAGDRDAAVRIDPGRHEVSGSVLSGGFCTEPDHYRLYFVASFDRAFRAYGTWRRQSLQPGSMAAEDQNLGDPWTTFGPGGPTAQAGAYATFDTRANLTVQMRVGISYVSVANARRNLEAETSGKSFDDIRADARKDWDDALSSIEVRAGPRNEVQRFYTALYQSLLEPSTFSDVDGRYVGMDGSIHRAQGYTQYADFSGWDVYRSQMALLAMLRPKQASDVAQSFVVDAQQSGWLPKWSVAAGHTDVMTGDPADPILASIYAFGARSFDAKAALAAMVKGGTEIGQSPNDGYVEREGLPAYLQFGYIPHELNGNSVSEGFFDYLRSEAVVPPPPPSQAALPWGSAGTTLEYATDDFAVSQLARALGETSTCRVFLRRSGSWRYLFNPATGYIEPRSASGAFLPSYNPNYNDPVSSQGFAEGDAAQYTWMVPHDPAGLAMAMGGRATATTRLDTFFTQLNAGLSSPYAFLGNEPNLNAPWLYNWFGQPYKTQQLLRRAVTELYPDNPGGFPGNDDLGEMSSWYVLSTIGLYPEIPGTDLVALSTPLFPDITLHLQRGTIELRAPQAGPGTPYIHRLTIDGRAYGRPWLTFSSLRNGSTLEFKLSSAPDRSWGAAPAMAPPSFQPDDPSGC